MPFVVITKLRVNTLYLRWSAAGITLLTMVAVILWRQQTHSFDSAQSELLIKAIAVGDTSGATFALAKGADPDYSPPVARSPLDSMRLQLHALCFWDQNLRRGAARAIMEHQMPPLALAVVTGRVEMVKLLLAHGARPDMPDSNGMTALILAANRTQQGSVTAEQMATLLLDRGANPNACSSLTDVCITPLSSAAFTSYPRPMVTLLLKRGAVPVDKETQAQLKRLHIAFKLPKNSP